MNKIYRCEATSVELLVDWSTMRFLQRNQRLEKQTSEKSNFLFVCLFLFSGHGTNTDTDNDNDLLQSTSTTRPSYPVNIIPHDGQLDNKSQSNSHQHFLNTPNQSNNELAIYSTSVASGASIETLKPSNAASSPPSSSPIKQNEASKSKPSLWADLFRSQTSSNAQTSVSNPQTTLNSISTSTSTSTASTSQTQQQQPATSPTKKSQSSSSFPRTQSGSQIASLPVQQNGVAPAKSNPNTTSSNYNSRTNYQVYNSNGGESKSLDGKN